MLRIDVLALDSLAADPSTPADGDVWFNSTDGVVRVRQGGATKILGIMTSAAPADVTKATAAVGTSNLAARQDHKHDISTAAPSIGIGGGSSEGSATSLARSDHNHAIRTTTGPTDLTVGAVSDGQYLKRSGTSIVGDTPAGSGTARDTVRFVLTGKPAVLTGMDGAWIAPRAGTITRITLWRRTAGASGSTTVDVNKNGTTLYTTQGNRPTVTQAAGNNAIDATTDMDVTSLAQNDRIEVDIDAVETGNPQDIAVIIEVSYT